MQKTTDLRFIPCFYYEENVSCGCQMRLSEIYGLTLLISFFKKIISETSGVFCTDSVEDPRRRWLV